jgi:hypothetical protein
VAIIERKIQFEVLPQSVYLLPKVHNCSHGHHKAADIAHGREAAFQWSPQAEAAFQPMKESLCIEPLLGYPRPDEKSTHIWELEVLLQLKGGQDHIVAY